LLNESAVSISFDETQTLVSDTYTYEATTADNETLSLDRIFPGQTDIPYVGASSIGYEWQPDNSVVITWTNPEGTFDQLRLVLYDQDDNTLLWVKLPDDTENMTIPSDWINAITTRMNPGSAKIEIQTRNVESDGNNYARGCSDTVSMSWGYGSISIDYGYVQYRSYENSDSNAVRGCLSLLKNGNPISENDISTIELKNSDGDTVPLTQVFYMENAIEGTWNEGTSSIDFSTYTDSFFMFRFPQTTALDPGSYTYEATTIDGDTLTLTLNYPEHITLPFVEDSSINYEWQEDDSLKVTWTNPEGDYDTIRFGLTDFDGNALAYVTLPDSAEEFVLPTEWVYYIEENMNPMLTEITIQTRMYADTEDHNNYARGYSDNIEAPWSVGVANSDILYGTWTGNYHEEDGDCQGIDSISFFEDGSFDEYDTYICNDYYYNYWFSAGGYWSVRNNIMRFMDTYSTSNNVSEEHYIYQPFQTYYFLTSTGALVNIEEEHIFVRDTDGTGLAGSWKRRVSDDDTNEGEFCHFIQIGEDGTLSSIDSCDDETETFTGTYQTNDDHFDIYDSNGDLAQELFYKLIDDTHLALPEVDEILIKE
jgi:hypothetical protein